MLILRTQLLRTPLPASKSLGHIGRPHSGSVDKDRLSAPVEARSGGEYL